MIAVYEIVSPSGKRYIGSTVNLDNRWRWHKTALKRGLHHSPMLQRACGKYGLECLEFRVLEILTEPSAVLIREQHFLDTLKPEYNTAKFAGAPTKGRPSSEEHRRKISASVKESWESAPMERREATRARARSMPKRGPQSEQEIEERRIRQASLMTPERCEQVRARHRGKVTSPETRAKMSAASKGRKKSPEHCAAIGASKRGRVLTQEQKDKIALGVSIARRKSNRS